MQGLQRAESPYIEKLYVDLSGVTYIFGQCLASMKAKFYNFDIILNGNGTIENRLGVSQWALLVSSINSQRTQ